MAEDFLSIKALLARVPQQSNSASTWSDGTRNTSPSSPQYVCPKEELHETPPTHCLCGGVGVYTIRCTPKAPGQTKCSFHGTPHACICKQQENAGTRHDVIRAESGLTLLHQARFTLRSFDPARSPAAREIHTAAVRMLTGEEQRPFLVLLGPPGTGKTHAALGIVYALVSRPVSAKYVTADDLLEDVREGAYTEGDSPDKRLKPYLDKPVLALDDVKVDQLHTAAAQNWIDRLITKRYDLAAPTIIVSNNDIDDFPKRIADRFKDLLLSRLIIADGPSQRSQGESRVVS